MDSLRVAIIGAGGMARQHLQVLQALPDIQVTAISSRGPERLNSVAKDFDIPQRFRNHQEMIRNTKPDAVFVLVSAANIYEVALSCIESKTPSLIEKPPGLIVSQTEALLKASEHVTAQYMVGLNRRFYSVFRNAKMLVDESGGIISVVVQAPEDIASIRAMNFHPLDVLDHWMAANGIHCIDLLRFFGGRVVSVHALSSAWRDGTPDSYGALLRFESGAIGHYVSDWISPGRWQVALYGFDMRVDFCPLEKGVITRRSGPSLEVPVDEVDLKFKPGLFGQDRYFLDRIRSDEPIERPAANLEDALGTMRLVEAIAYSHGSEVMTRGNGID